MALAVVSPTMTPPIRPGPAGRRDGIDHVERDAGLVQRALDQMVERLDMGPGGDFRHHAAERGMFVDLRQHDIGENRAAAVLAPAYQRGGGFVAGRLDAEDNHRGILQVGVGGTSINV